MGKLKDAITDVTFTLKGVSMTTIGKETYVKRTEETYEYVGDNGAELKFHAHPTRAWKWVIVSSNPLGKLASTKIIEAFVSQIMNSPAKDYYTVIKTLKI